MRLYKLKENSSEIDFERELRTSLEKGISDNTQLLEDIDRISAVDTDYAYSLELHALKEQATDLLGTLKHIRNSL